MPKKELKSELVAIRVKPTMLKKLKELSFADSRSVSSWVVLLLEKKLRK